MPFTVKINLSFRDNMGKKAGNNNIRERVERILDSYPEGTVFNTDMVARQFPKKVKLVPTHNEIAHVIIMYRRAEKVAKYPTMWKMIA